MSEHIQMSLWDEPEPAAPPQAEYHYGDYIEAYTKYEDSRTPGYNTPAKLAQLAGIISRQKYHGIEMHDGTGKRMPTLVVIQGACVDGNMVKYWGTLIEACTIYGGRSGSEPDDYEDDE